MVLLLGTGTSIKQEASIFSAQHDMDIAFLRGDSNVHTVMKEIRMQDPYRLVNQVKNQEKHKVEIAKEFLKLRFKLLKYENSFIDQIYDLKTHQKNSYLPHAWGLKICFNSFICSCVHLPHAWGLKASCQQGCLCTEYLPHVWGLKESKHTNQQSNRHLLHAWSLKAKAKIKLLELHNLPHVWGLKEIYLLVLYLF